MYKNIGHPLWGSVALPVRISLQNLVIIKVVSVRLSRDRQYHLPFRVLVKSFEHVAGDQQAAKGRDIEPALTLQYVSMGNGRETRNVRYKLAH